jgi:multidrug efflux pump subunit AcrA (membrane-fusion protein)
MEKVNGVLTTICVEGIQAMTAVAVNDSANLWAPLNLLRIVGVVSADNSATIKTVKLGPQFGDMWEVESGLQVGDTIGVDGLQRINSGMTVTPTPFKDTQANATPGGQ